MVELMVNLTCQECGNPFATAARYLKRGRGKFCSRTCQLVGAQRARWDKHHATVQEWFWNRMDNSGGDDACWVWAGRKGKRNYGRLVWRGVTMQAHRLAAILGHGEPPTPQHLSCHSCDNEPCCNPRHLWWGTHQENMDDMHAKGRGRWEPNSAALRARAAMAGKP